MLDVSGLIPEAQPLARKVSAVYIKHMAPFFIGLIAHGSAVKGGIIPGCSDIDFQLYLEEAALSLGGQLPLELGFAIRRDLEGLNMGPFRYVQCYAHGRKLQQGFVGPIPGAYHLIAGQLPVPEATTQDLRASARKVLAELNPAPTYIMGKLLGPGGVRLARSIRLLCTQVWPTLYQVLTLRQSDAVSVWCLPKARAIAKLPENIPLGSSIRWFHQTVRAYYPAEDDLEGALRVIESGVAFLEAAKFWWEGSIAESRN
jgi:hypothetical protein